MIQGPQTMSFETDLRIKLDIVNQAAHLENSNSSKGDTKLHKWSFNATRAPSGEKLAFDWKCDDKKDFTQIPNGNETFIRS